MYNQPVRPLIIFFTLLTGALLCCCQRLNVACDPGWTPYKDEKCIKLIDNLVTFTNAEAACIAQIEEPMTTIPPLLTIKSADEQEFLTKFLFEDLAILENVWMAANRVNGTQTFHWSDGAPFTFTHWREGFPSTIMEDECVQMTPTILKDAKNSKAPGDGFWTDISCLKRNLIVCQKLPTWSLNELQRAVLELRRNPVPIGFVYVQLPNKPDAATTWPSLGWKDVTVEYSGLFFRAEGGQSESFGTPQGDQTRRLVTVKGAGVVGKPDPTTISVPENACSAWVFSGYSHNGEWYDGDRMQFCTNGGEIRPINTAVRIWERIY